MENSNISQGRLVSYTNGVLDKTDYSHIVVVGGNQRINTPKNKKVKCVQNVNDYINVNIDGRVKTQDEKSR